MGLYFSIHRVVQAGDVVQVGIYRGQNCRVLNVCNSTCTFAKQVSMWLGGLLLQMEAMLAASHTAIECYMGAFVSRGLL